MFTIQRQYGLALLMGALAGCTPHTTERYVDAEVGGHRVHLLILGERQNKPAVVLESGAGGGMGWMNVRSQIAQFAQVITYDRAGTGDSAPGPKPRDATTIAGELRTALQQAGVAPPYVLVGQSLGGLYVQVFAARYPKETAGLVLVDPTHSGADFCRSTDEVKAWFTVHDAEDWPHVEAACQWAPEELRSFLACKYAMMEAFIESIAEPRRAEMRREWWGMVGKLTGGIPPSKIAGGAREELEVMDDSIREAMAARPLPEVPMLLLAGSKTDLDALAADAATPNVKALQAESRRWNMAAFQKWVDDTPGAKLLIVPGSGHDIQSERPQAVIDAVREVLQ